MWFAPQRRAIILLYHRVAEVESDPQLLCVTPQHFAEQLDYLRRYYSPITLLDLKKTLAKGKAPHKAVIVTFDDGYADNLWNAKPVLERYDIPATVFVTSGSVNRNQEFWWDDLERLLLLPDTLPNSFETKINGKVFSWNLRSINGDSAKDQNNKQWTVLSPGPLSPRQDCYKQLHMLLRPLDCNRRQAALRDLAQWAGLPINGRSDYRALNHAELQELTKDGLVEVGAHTVTHPVLGGQAASVQFREIVESRQYLEDALGRPVTSFAYPYGAVDDVGPETVALTRKAGFDVACGNFPRPVTQRSNPFWLPRCVVRDWDGDEFGRQLKAYFDG